jgi:hypothetical protein
VTVYWRGHGVHVVCEKPEMRMPIDRRSDSDLQDAEDVSHGYQHIRGLVFAVTKIYFEMYVCLTVIHRTGSGV